MTEKDLTIILQGNNQFAISLYQKLAANDGNIFFSPTVIHSLLALMSQDSWFYNKHTFNHALKVPDVNIAAENYKNIFTFLNLIDDASPLMANKVFVKDSCKLQELFRTCLTNNFLYDIISLNFNKNEDAANLINTWIENKTFKKTKNLMNSGSPAGRTCLMLLNAMNFNGKWAEPFDVDNTEPAAFHINNNDTILVQMMKIKKEFYYKTDNMLGVKILELPYVNSDISLVVILPNDNTGIRSCEHLLTFHDLVQITENMVKQEVDVSLPKFKIEDTIELKDYLCKLGLEEAFNADLFEMIEGEEISLNQVKQKAFIGINEEGTETAAGMVSDFSTVQDEEEISKDGLIIYEMKMNTKISNRFANTKVVWKLRNIEKQAKMVNFKVVLTETAFITEFVMEIKEKSYKSYIKEKDVAKNIYNEALARGQSAGLVEAKTRDSKEFTVSVNMEPELVAMFSLTYEEMLERVHDQYELVLNICPGQIVQNLDIEVQITESRPLKFVKTPPLRCGNDIRTQENATFLEPSSEIQMNLNTAIIKFHPDSKKQKKFGHYLEENISNGLSGQFVVQYDVERDPLDGEVLLRDGYFVHFFAPNDLDPLPKHVVFALDTSGSMGGRKIDQLKDAMMSILSEIKKNDMISIIEFNTEVIVWDITTKNSTVLPRNADFLEPFKQLSELSLPDPTSATDEMISNAKIVVRKMYGCGSTFMIGGLQTALYLVKIGQEKTVNKNEKCQPIIVFLTDGEPNVVLNSTEKIVEIVTMNNRNIKVPIFSLSFGYGADKNFLRKLSLKNQGFSRHIYEASDAALQLQEFYKQISSPLLSDIKFKYDSEVEEVTRTFFPIYFRGSELVVCGKYKDSLFPTCIDCFGPRGPIIIRSTIETLSSPIERLWAYLTVKQLLEERESVDDKTELTKKAVDLALKYSFVTDVTSLVVVKPNETNALNEGSTVPPKSMNRMNPFTMPGPVIPQTNISQAKSASAAPQWRSGNSCLFGSSRQLSGEQGGFSGQLFGAQGGSSGQLFDAQDGSSGQLFGAQGASAAPQLRSGNSCLFGSSGQLFGAQGGFSGQLFGAQGRSSGRLFNAQDGSSGQLFGAQGGSSGQVFGAQEGGSAQLFGVQRGSGQVFGAQGGISPFQGFDMSAGSSGQAIATPGAFSIQGFHMYPGTSSVQDFGTSGGSSKNRFSALREISTGRSFGTSETPGTSSRQGTSRGISSGQGTSGEVPLNLKKRTEEFLADHPFMIFLKFKKGNKVIILFKGRVLKPIY